MNHLKELFSPVPVRSIEEFGIPAPVGQAPVAGCSGGGWPLGLPALRDRRCGRPVSRCRAIGPAQAKEPIAFAFFALRAIQGKINHLPSVTGAKRATVLGKLTLPSPANLSPRDGVR